MPRNVPLLHPGEILLEEFLRPMGLTQYQLAKELMADVLATIRRLGKGVRLNDINAKIVIIYKKAEKF